MGGRCTLLFALLSLCQNSVSVPLLVTVDLLSTGRVEWVVSEAVRRQGNKWIK
jgi:hypothetical protein